MPAVARQRERSRLLHALQAFAMSQTCGAAYDKAVRVLRNRRALTLRLLSPESREAAIHDRSQRRVDTVAHVIQVALTPVFLLSGIASLLSVLATRLGRVADRVDRVRKARNRRCRERVRLETRLAFLEGEPRSSTPR